MTRGRVIHKGGVLSWGLAVCLTPNFGVRLGGGRTLHASTLGFAFRRLGIEGFVNRLALRCEDCPLGCRKRGLHQVFIHFDEVGAQPGQRGDDCRDLLPS